MAESDLGLNLDQIEQNAAQDAQNKLEVKNRYKDLSEKVILVGKEKEEAEARFKNENEAKIKVEKERDFYRDFSQLSSRYPNATQYQDKIKEKVDIGYSPEDATLAVLAKENKLQPITADTQPYRPANVAGGSAPTQVSDSMDKHPQDMNQDERRKALQDLENQGINIFRS